MDGRNEHKKIDEKKGIGQKEEKQEKMRETAEACRVGIIDG
jgi:hypothetical protein